MQLSIFFFLTDTHPSTGVGNTVFKESKEKVAHLLPNYEKKTPWSTLRFCHAKRGSHVEQTLLVIKESERMNLSVFSGQGLF